MCYCTEESVRMLLARLDSCDNGCVDLSIAIVSAISFAKTEVDIALSSCGLTYSCLIAEGETPPNDYNPPPETVQQATAYIAAAHHLVQSYTGEDDNGALAKADRFRSQAYHLLDHVCPEAGDDFSGGSSSSDYIAGVPGTKRFNTRLRCQRNRHCRSN